MKIGILALQGAFIEHEKILQSLNVDCLEIRQKSDLKQYFNGLIIPGGESTVMGKLLVDLDLYQPLMDLISNGFPVFGTCAGLLLLAKNIVNDDKTYFGTMDITVRRNAYGRQLGSFYTKAGFENISEFPMTFIRAPYIESVSNDTEILATVEGNIVAAKQKSQLVTAFHPELTGDTRVHKYFIDSCF